ncbi:hypothetical protein TGAM01_v205781 [Trichoderma gamsii]|uniref:Xylanolytic transcriptional activator regulatory domain-containing protein n=2 Tax=Trichoderma gamsii TaxID=398673 RepID=A0A2P4ZMG8_9HYPO|nr:hypothetical protein TGAM01_v205781 [Trichoderma gamsii]PON25487.1 hypothetical protein TGAM01_v205781 [Trichoderma gamsii]
MRGFCSGERPKCASCVSRNTPCEYNTATDETHSNALKRKYDELLHRKTHYEELYELLQTRPPEEATEVYKRIRAGDDAGFLLRLIQDGNLLLQMRMVPESRYRYRFPYIDEMPAFLMHPPNPYLDSLLYESTFRDRTPPASQSMASASSSAAGGDEHQGVYLKPFHAAEVMDAKLELIKPSAWTSISSDDNLMRKLFNIYFLQEYHAAPFFHKDYFLEDMIAKRHEFCSSLLVNAILTIACHSDHSNPNRAEFWNPNNRAYQFLAETRRLWELEAREPNLMTVQATLILHIIYNMNGTDELGYRYLEQAVDMANGLNLFKPSAVASGKERNARELTAWVLYGWQGVMAYMHQRVPLCQKAPESPLPDPFEHPQWYGDIWFKFPSAPTMFSTHLSQYTWAKIQLWCIARDMASQMEELKARHAELLATQVLAFCSKLAHWYRTLPRCMRPDRIVTPYQLQLHMQFHNYIINLLEEPMVTKLDNPQFIDVFSQSLGQKPRELLSSSKRSFETLIRLYYLRHGFKALDYFMVQYLSMLAFMAHGAIHASMHETTLQSLQSTILLATMGLRDQSASFYTGRMVFKAVRKGMRSEEIELIDRFTAQGRRIESQPPPGWRAISSWGLDFGSISADRAASNLGKLFEEARISELAEHDYYE